MRRLFAAVLAGVAGFVALNLAVALTGITNGSFEQGPNPPDWWWSIPAGSSALPGWTVVSGDVDQYSSGPNGWEAANGRYSMNLDGNVPGVIAQALNTVAGSSYVVTFALSGNPDPYTAFPPGWTPVKRVRVSAAGSSQDYSYDIVAKANTHADMKYEYKSFTFAATGASTTLTFRSLSSAGWWGAVIDDVSIKAFTGDLCKDGGWESLTDAAGNAFKNQGDCVSYAATGGRNVAATDPNHGNIGTENHFGPYSIQDYDGHFVTYTCSYVHRKLVPGGFEEKQSCTLAETAHLPKKPVTRVNPHGWCSDFYLSSENRCDVIATTFTATYLPSGQVLIVSFYAAP